MLDSITSARDGLNEIESDAVNLIARPTSNLGIKGNTDLVMVHIESDFPFSALGLPKESLVAPDLSAGYVVGNRNSRLP